MKYLVFILSLLIILSCKAEEKSTITVYKTDKDITVNLDSIVDQTSDSYNDNETYTLKIDSSGYIIFSNNNWSEKFNINLDNDIDYSFYFGYKKAFYKKKERPTKSDYQF